MPKMKSVRYGKVGTMRERGLPKKIYYSDEYFNLRQLYTFAHQIHDIHKTGAKKILEVGPGNGFTSTYLQRAGKSVTTVDINPKLHPDFCVPVEKIGKIFAKNSFELLVCCEVLEHLPYTKFEECIINFKKISPNLYLTLPNYFRSFGFGGFFRLPKIEKPISLFLNICLPKKMCPQHFWEINSNKNTSKKRIIHILKSHYKKCEHWQHLLNPYHTVFLLRNGNA